MYLLKKRLDCYSFVFSAHAACEELLARLSADEVEALLVLHCTSMVLFT